MVQRLILIPLPNNHPPVINVEFNDVTYTVPNGIKVRGKFFLPITSYWVTVILVTPLRTYFLEKAVVRSERL
jgi:hypothetical protein